MQPLYPLNHRGTHLHMRGWPYSPYKQDTQDNDLLDMGYYPTFRG